MQILLLYNKKICSKKKNCWPIVRKSWLLIILIITNIYFILYYAVIIFVAMSILFFNIYIV